VTDGSKSGAHDRSRRRRFRAGAGALALAVVAAFAGCRRDDVPAAAPFGGTLAAPLPHRDVLGFLVVDPADSAWLARPELKLGPLDLTQTSIVAPLLAMVQLVRDHDVVPRGSRLALLFLDTDVHGGLAAYAWRGDAKSLRAAADAAQIPFDAEGRLLLPGRGRARDLDLLTDALRRRDRSDAPLPREVVMPDATSRRHEVPRLPHWVVERDGVVLVLPAADGERNLFDTLAATRLLDVEAARLPCLRLAFGRLNDRYRATLGNYLDLAINLLLPID